MAQVPDVRKGGAGRDEHGFVLVGALLILLLLVLIGVAATTNTSLELQIAGIDRIRKETFYAADSGVYMAPRLITLAREGGADPATGPLVPIGPQFYNRVMGFTPGAADFDLDVWEPLLEVDVDIEHRGAQHMAGGGAEFGAGSGGVGAGSTGGVMIRYDIDSVATGNAPKNSEAGVLARYRYVPGTAGGMK